GVDVGELGGEGEPAGDETRAPDVEAGGVVDGLAERRHAGPRRRGLRAGGVGELVAAAAHLGLGALDLVVARPLQQGPLAVVGGRVDRHGVVEQEVDVEEVGHDGTASSKVQRSKLSVSAGSYPLSWHHASYSSM